MEEKRTDDIDKLRVNTEKLSEQDLEELARCVVRKLKESMGHERDRSGRL